MNRKSAGPTQPTPTRSSSQTYSLRAGWQQTDAAVEPRAPGPDAVSAYLTKLERCPLLTREREVEIARRIEQGQADVLAAVLSSPTAVKDVIELGEQLRAHGSRPLPGEADPYEEIGRAHV
jgi:hypothetical protein